MGEHMGSRVANVIFRFFQLSSAAIVAGIVGWALHRIDTGNGSSNGKLIYVELVAAMSIVVSIVLIVPFEYVFKAWPLDIIFFIMWLVGFALLADLGGTGECESQWYVSYWGWYWAGMWRTPGGIPSSRACRNWRAVLGFTCISWILFLASSLVGIYLFVSRSPSDRHSETHYRRLQKPWQREKHVKDASTESRTDGPATTQLPGA